MVRGVRASKKMFVGVKGKIDNGILEPSAPAGYFSNGETGSGENNAFDTGSRVVILVSGQYIRGCHQ